jgi:hypothetical protein
MPSNQHLYRKGEFKVKKIVSIVLVLAFCFMTTVALAGGDKNRGDKGKGEITRTQITGKGK